MQTHSIQFKTLKDIKTVVIENESAIVTVSLFGGHILSFIPKRDGVERLWLSPNALLDNNNPIRGGIPICWPWFSDLHGHEKGALPSHGFVRNQLWQLTHSEQSAQSSVICLSPQTTSAEGFVTPATLELRVTVSDTLSVELITTNTGKSAFTYTCALHTYFAVDDIHTTELIGLSGIYEDKTQAMQRFTTPTSYTFTQETDRVHFCTPESLTVVTSPQSISIGSKGHDSVVVWNPWHQNSINMRDMTDEGYADMLCVETAITQGLSLAPGNSHTLKQMIA